jgi:hypothetical protein
VKSPVVVLVKDLKGLFWLLSEQSPYSRLVSLIRWFDTNVFVSWGAARKEKDEGGRGEVCGGQN